MKKVFRFNVCLECEKNYVCSFKDDGHLKQRKLVDFLNSKEGDQLNEIQSHSGRPFSVKLVCSEFSPKKEH